MIRTGDEYRESIRDGREVWVNGERVTDVPSHPMFKPVVDIRARIYVPQNDIVTAPRPMILFLHGGGFVLGDVDQYDASPRALAARTGAGEPAIA